MLRVGIIGAGSMGNAHADVYTKMGNIEVAAVCDSRIEKARNIACRFGTDAYTDAVKMISEKKLDMVDVCLPTPFHREFALISLKNGIHVLCEKPFALNIADAVEMFDASKQYGVFLMIAHCLRFSREYCLLKEHIKDKKYGKLISLNLHRNSPTPAWSEGNWLTDSTKSGGVAMDLHIHDTDMIQYLLGRPRAVTSYGNTSSISTLYEYPGIVLYAEASWRPQATFPYSMGYDAVFERASIVFKNKMVVIYEENREPFIVDNNDWINNYKMADLSDNFYFNEIKYFTDCIEKGTKPVVSTPEDSLQSLEIILTEIKSAEHNQKIYL